MSRILDFEQAAGSLAPTRPGGADLVAEMVSPELFASSIECTAPFGDMVTLLDPGLSRWLRPAGAICASASN